MIDVAVALPGQRVAQPPSFAFEDAEGALHLGFRVRADARAVCQACPVAGVDAEPGGDHEQRRGHRQKAGEDGEHREDECDRGCRGGAARALESP